MKKLKIFAMILWFMMLISTINLAQAQTFKHLDEVPHDITYYKKTQTGEPQIKVVYGRPETDNQKVFGEIIPFGQVWRTGANETTEIKFYQDLMFGNILVKEGTYSLYTIPGETYWTIILNSETDTLGSFFYNEELDVARIEVPSLAEQQINVFTIGFDQKNYGTQMILAWGETRVKVPLYLEKELIS
jgi:hypothetical protein